MSKKNKKSYVEEKYKYTNVKSNPAVNFVMYIILILGVVYFFSNLIIGKVDNLGDIINMLLIVLFTISFCVIGLTIKLKNKNIFVIGSLCLVLFYSINIMNTFNIFKFDSVGRVINFNNMELTKVVSWSQRNNIELNQEYEFSDMIEEYRIISQLEAVGTKIKDIKSINVSVSEGPNPYKEIIIPNMIGWDSERVINYVNKNYLNNVNVTFVANTNKENTVVEQDKIGNVRRNEEINLVFSYGEELGYEEVKLIDFTNMNKFEVEFYMKQHLLKYKLDEGFSSKIKKGLAIKQSKKPGEMVKINDEEIIVTLSKGPKIVVPDLTKMSNKELVNWIIENRLKIKYSDRYDDTIKKNSIIETNYKKNDVVAQGTTIEVILSKGALKMKSFSSLNEFKEWADKYSIKYEEQHEFSDSVKIGEVISYSYKNGDTINNNDVIIVKISDGEKKAVPNLVGLTKKEIENKLDKLDLNYNYVYKSSNSVKEGLAISQSISKGSEVSSGTTITITISTGKRKTNSGGSSNSGSGSSSNNNPPATPSCDKSKGEVLNIQSGGNGNETKSIIQQLNPNHKFNFNMVSNCPNGSKTPGEVCPPSYDGVWKNFCDTITITIVQ